jgi:hypothetical protein
MRSNKPLVPTRTGEAPVLAAQRRRYVLEEASVRILSPIVLVVANLHWMPAVAERSIYDCKAAPPKVELEQALQLVQADLKKWHRGSVSFESAVLQCQDKKDVWEVQARPRPYSSTKFVFLVHMDGSVINSGVITDG